MTLCTATSLTDGGRAEIVCGSVAESDQICAECGQARCRECGDISFAEVTGRVLCEDCQLGAENGQ